MAPPSVRVEGTSEDMKAHRQTKGIRMALTVSHAEEQWCLDLALDQTQRQWDRDIRMFLTKRAKQQQMMENKLQRSKHLHSRCIDISQEELKPLATDPYPITFISEARKKKKCLRRRPSMEFEDLQLDSVTGSLSSLSWGLPTATSDSRPRASSFNTTRDLKQQSSCSKTHTQPRSLPKIQCQHCDTMVRAPRYPTFGAPLLNQSEPMKLGHDIRGDSRPRASSFNNIEELKERRRYVKERRSLGLPSIKSDCRPRRASFNDRDHRHFIKEQTFLDLPDISSNCQRSSFDSIKDLSNIKVSEVTH